VRDNSYWADFPDTYRSEQIETIAKWIAVGDSGVVIGGSGTGKSNLVGFFTTRQDVVGRHLPGAVDDYLFLHMDVNSLPTVTTPFFYRSMLLTLQRAAGEIDPALVAQINQSMAGLIGPEDTLGLHFALQTAHDLLINSAQKRLVWIMDRFDEACVKLEATTLNSLRNLRDHNRVKGRLSYVLFTRHPLARLRNPRDYDEFHEIVIPNTCWVGPMVPRDARWMAQQMAERHQVTFGGAAIQLLIDLSGGLPAFLKAACTALATGTLWPGESAFTWLDRILEELPVQRNCQEMWDDLQPGEKDVLSAIAAGVAEEKLDAATIHYLEQASLLARTPNGVRIFSPIFELFVIRQKVYVASGISFDAVTGAVRVNDKTLRVKLTPEEHRVLAYLAERKGEACTLADLLVHISPNGASAVAPQGYLQDSATDEREAQLLETVQQLRDKIEQSDGSGANSVGLRIQIIDDYACRLVEAGADTSIQIAIDENKFQQQVSEIVESDFFRNLQAQVQRVRTSKAGSA
jgi:hypothetical protein